MNDKPQFSRRQAHYMKRNDRSETLHQCVWYDCETRSETDDEGVTKHILVFGWASYRRRTPRGTWTQAVWIRFTEGKELWKWITSLSRPKKTLYVWAHNHFFDFTASCAYASLPLLGWSLKDAIIDSPPFVLKYKDSSRKLVLVDTLNIWRSSLAELGKKIGLPKLDMPETWTGTDSDDTYCRRDVEIIMLAVCQWADFLHSEDMGKFCLTIASQAMQTFRHRYLQDEILVDDNLEALSIARDSYHGGRVECNYIGELMGPLYLLDFNSLYPYCMAAFEYPTKLVRVIQHPTTEDVRSLLSHYLCCARVLVEIDEPMVARIKDGKLTFPVGRFEADVSTPELEYMLERNGVREVTAVAVYEKARPFVQFVHDLYTRRRAAADSGNRVEELHYKLLLNSFYGKWGQNGIKWTTVGNTIDEGVKFWREIDYTTREVTCYRQWQGLIQRRDVSPESRESCPAIAAHITAHARMVLWALMRKATPVHYFYCDTDSILVDKEGLEFVKESISNEILGGLKLVGEFAHGRIYGCKDYVLDGVRTCKGVRNHAVEFEPNRYRQEQWIGFRRALRNGWLDAPRVLSITKFLRREYDKGIVSSSGFVFPIHV